MNFEREILVVAALLVMCGSCRSANSGGAESSAQTSVTSAAHLHADTLWLLAADPSRDAVHASDTETELITRYGTANVRRDSIYEGEGMHAGGAIVFPGDSLRELEVIWLDAKNFARPRRVIVRGRRSRWALFPGVSLGTCLTEVERINGRPFKIYGFGFDGAGVSDGWGKGRLETLWGSETYPRKRVWLRFAETVPVRFRRDQMGDVLIPSTDSILRAAKPCVVELSVWPR
jgi:hypothetical protein